MKKLALLLATALAFSGLVAISSGTATASPYPGTVSTHSKVAVKHKKSHKKHLRPTIRVTTSGNATVKGVVRIRAINRNGRIRTYSFVYSGNHAYTLPRLPRGIYKIKVTFVPKSGSVFKGSTGSSTHRVRIV